MVPTVLVVDDQPAFRHAARELLSQDGFPIVGEAADCAQALAAERRLLPDVVLLDVRLPDGSGIDVARAMSGKAEPPIVVLTSTADYRHAVSGCGARAFLSKAQLSGRSLRAALGGGR